MADVQRPGEGAPTDEAVQAAVDVVAAEIDASIIEFVDVRVDELDGSAADPRAAARVAVEALVARPEVLAALAARAPQPPREHVGAEADGVLWMAMRYALGRATYAVAEVGDAIREHAHRLPAWHRARMVAEIEQAGATEVEIDGPRWRQTVADLRAPQPAPVEPPAAGERPILPLEQQITGIRNALETAAIEVDVWETDTTGARTEQARDPLHRLARCLRSAGLLDDLQYDDPHDGEACADVENRAETAQNQLNEVAHQLARRGLPVNLDHLARSVSQALGPRARYLASPCAGCGHTYNFHASTGRCDGARPMSLPPDGAGVAQCGCQNFIDAPAAPVEPLHEVECPACSATIRARMANAPDGPVAPGVAALLARCDEIDELASRAENGNTLPSTTTIRVTASIHTDTVRALLAGGDR